MKTLAAIVAVLALVAVPVVLAARYFAPEPLPAQHVGTVERRIHLSIDGKWDSDKRRTFLCVERE